MSEKGNLKLPREILLLQPQKIVQRRKSDGSALKQNKRLTRLSVDQLPKVPKAIASPIELKRTSKQKLQITENKLIKPPCNKNNNNERQAKATQPFKRRNSNTADAVIQSTYQLRSKVNVCDAILKTAAEVLNPTTTIPISANKTSGTENSVELPQHTTEIVERQAKATQPFRRRNSSTLHTTQKFYVYNPEDADTELAGQPPTNMSVCEAVLKRGEELLPPTKTATSKENSVKLQQHMSDEISSLETIEREDPQIQDNVIEEIEDDFDILEFFNIQCYASLSGAIDCCPKTSHESLRDKLDVKEQLLTMPQAQVKKLYLFVRKRTKLFSTYYEAFTYYFAETKSINGLRRLLHDGNGAYTIYFPAKMLIYLYEAFKYCGLNSQEACNLLLKETKPCSTASISALLEIIFVSDWTAFVDNIKALASHPAAIISVEILEKMADHPATKSDTQLASIFYACILKCPAQDMPRIFNNKNVLQWFDAFYAKLHK